MTRLTAFEPEFVEEMSRELAPGVLYVSMAYGTTSHLCFCGCGAEVVLPLHPTGWTLTFDGEHVSLDHSVGSWALPCKSHYFLRENRVRWASSWSEEKIAAVRERDRAAVGSYYEEAGDTPRGRAGARRRWWQRVAPRPR